MHLHKVILFMCSFWVAFILLRNTVSCVGTWRMAIKPSLAANGNPNNPYKTGIRIHSIYPDITFDQWVNAFQTGWAMTVRQHLFPMTHTGIIVHFKKWLSHLTDFMPFPCRLIWTKTYSVWVIQSVQSISSPCHSYIYKRHSTQRTENEWRCLYCSTN